MARATTPPRPVARLLWPVAVLTALAPPAPLPSRAAAPSRPAPAPAAEADEEEEFEPRVGSAPAARQSAGTRGGGAEETPEVCVLAPEEVVGLTTTSQPVLLWSISRATDKPVELVVVDLKTLKEVFSAALDGVKTPGIQRLDLAREKDGASGKAVRLDAGKRYEFVVAVVMKEGNSANPVAACRFMVLDPAAMDAAAPAGDDPAGREAFYREQGVWFDYLAALSERIDADPADAKLRDRRARVLGRQALIEEAGGHVRDVKAERGRTGGPSRDK